MIWLLAGRAMTLAMRLHPPEGLVAMLVPQLGRRAAELESSGFASEHGRIFGRSAQTVLEVFQRVAIRQRLGDVLGFPGEQINAMTGPVAFNG